MIELSSGEEDALHIVDSSASVSEDDEEEEKGGTHVNDVLNQRDALGRVLVNLNHPPEEENVFLAPQLARAVKPHQVQQTGTLLRCLSASWLGHGLLLVVGVAACEVLVLYHEQLLAQARSFFLAAHASGCPMQGKGRASALPCHVKGAGSLDLMILSLLL